MRGAHTWQLGVERQCSQHCSARSNFGWVTPSRSPPVRSVFGIKWQLRASAVARDGGGSGSTAFGRAAAAGAAAASDRAAPAVAPCAAAAPCAAGVGVGDGGGFFNLPITTGTGNFCFVSLSTPTTVEIGTGGGGALAWGMTSNPSFSAMRSSKLPNKAATKSFRSTGAQIMALRS
jgi:hypothetical protein